MRMLLFNSIKRSLRLRRLTYAEAPKAAKGRRRVRLELV